MKRAKSLLLLIVIIACGLIASYISSTYAEDKTYEVYTEYSLPEYRTDTARAIDAYQQMINRLLDTNERNNAVIIAKLDAIQKDLQLLSTRIENIEKAVSCRKIRSKECTKDSQLQLIIDPNLPAPEPMKQN
jgi:GTPase Era involved in 16S rRNA processing